MATYLVTGVAGFIASKVAEQLLDAGHTVVGVDNLNDYYDVRLKDYRLSRLLGVSCSLLGTDPKKSIFEGVGRVALNAPGSGIAPNNQQPATNNRGTFVFYAFDIEDMPALERVFERHKFAAIFNLAARAGVRASLENPAIYRSTNILGEENVLKCQVKFGVRKHVLASSSSVYAGCPMPFTEDATLGPGQSPYAETKKAAEALAKDYHDKHGLDVTVLRYFTVFGPAGRPDMAPFRFIKWIDEGTPITLYGDGSAARDFTYIDDIARGTVLAGNLFGSQLRTLNVEHPTSNAADLAPGSKLPAPSYEVVNLGGGNRPLTISAMIAIIEQAIGKKAIINRLPPSPADMPETSADITKANRLLSWKPEVSPVDGFRKTVEWYLQNRDWLGHVHV